MSSGVVTCSAAGVSTVVPNCLYVGTSKAGSTWIFDLLARHPSIYACPGKGLYFFDSHYDNGMAWYLSHFQSARDESIVVEISHSYLYSASACRRIAELNPGMKILACLREPADRAFSDYLDHVKNGKYTGSFERAIEELPSIVERGKYATYLRPYLETFGAQQIHLSVFDQLSSDPQQFADRLFDFLGVPVVTLSSPQTKKIMPAGRPRARRLSLWTKAISKRLKRVGLKPVMGRIKRSRAVRNLLYRPYTESEKPRPTARETEVLREIFAPEVKMLDTMFGTQFCRYWGCDRDSQNLS